MSKSKEPFKPVVPADQTQPELTVTSVILGIVLAVVFGAANAYLGLRVGSVLQENRWRPAQFLRCRRYFCGRRKGKWRRPACWRLRFWRSAADCLEHFL